ncbi:MAG: multiple sugar transport system substrate-binding protein [Clostridiales bacterium]|jgi:multiple sugar transport system substrate-binding protein|nr:multiple sugar transport system substrate-binding protein [Clostridiales bacterium]
MRGNRGLFLLIFLWIILSVTGCSGEDAILDPDHPITITVWHYYNGQINEEFNQLVDTFNNTVGMEQGIVVDAMSQGDVSQLAEAVFDAANEKIGSLPLPNVFAAYPDNAYRINEIVPLVDMGTYFSEEELSLFRPEFLDEGRFGEKDALRILPVAKSTENLFLNATDWTNFSEATGHSVDDLQTWEGIIEAAADYYDWTDAMTETPNDGQAFIGIDSMPNFMLISAEQLDAPLYVYENGTVRFQFSEETARKIWDTYYVPSIRGYFLKTGRFCSDDAKVGKVLGYTGSTAGAGYFPKEVTLSQSDSYEIESLVLPYPYFEGGQKVAIHQGAGLCITSGDEAHEYASAVFLKWFTALDNNLKFAVATGYFPGMAEAQNAEMILSARSETDQEENPTIIESIETTSQMFETYTFYGNRPFEGSYDMRSLLETSLPSWLERDKKALEDAGDSSSELLETYLSDEHFMEWYQAVMAQADSIMK